MVTQFQQKKFLSFGPSYRRAHHHFRHDKRQTELLQKNARHHRLLHSASRNRKHHIIWPTAGIRQPTTYLWCATPCPCTARYTPASHWWLRWRWSLQLQLWRLRANAGVTMEFTTTCGRCIRCSARRSNLWRSWPGRLGSRPVISRQIADPSIVRAASGLSKSRTGSQAPTIAEQITAWEVARARAVRSVQRQRSRKEGTRKRKEKVSEPFTKVSYRQRSTQAQEEQKGKAWWSQGQSWR